MVRFRDEGSSFRRGGEASPRGACAEAGSVGVFDSVFVLVEQQHREDYEDGGLRVVFGVVSG